MRTLNNTSVLAVGAVLMGGALPAGCGADGNVVSDEPAFADAGEEGADIEEPSTGDEIEDAVVDVESLLITDEDAEGQGITADGVHATVAAAREFVNDLLRQAFGELKTLAATDPVVSRLLFRQWQHVGHDPAVEYQLSVLRVGPKGKTFLYGLRVRPTGGGDDAWVKVLWGGLAKAGVRRGAGRIHADFDAWKTVKADLGYAGKAEFRFVNHGLKRVVAFGAKALVTPRVAEPVTGVIQYFSKGAGAKRGFRFIHHADVVDGPAGKEWVGARVTYKIGTGGFIAARVHGGDVPADQDPTRIHGCWGPGREWIFVKSEPVDHFADVAPGATAADCIEDFKDAGGEPVDPAATDDSDWERTEDFAVPELPSEQDAAAGAEDPGT